MNKLLDKYAIIIVVKMKRWFFPSKLSKYVEIEVLTNKLGYNK